MQGILTSHPHDADGILYMHSYDYFQQRVNAFNENDKSMSMNIWCCLFLSIYTIFRSIQVRPGHRDPAVVRKNICLL